MIGFIICTLLTYFSYAYLFCNISVEEIKCCAVSILVVFYLVALSVVEKDHQHAHHQLYLESGKTKVAS